LERSVTSRVMSPPEETHLISISAVLVPQSI
jgi:hypothetical protein